MTQKPQNHHDGLPVSQAILAKTTVFTSYSKKKKKMAKTHSFGRFCQNKVISQLKHTFEQLWKKIDAIGNNTENSQVPS